MVLPRPAPDSGAHGSPRGESAGLRWYVVGVLWAVALGALFSPWSRGLTGDVWWHLATGAWILAHHAIPWTNPFGPAAGSTLWINLEWGWDVLTGLLVRAFGYPGLAAWALAMVIGVAASQWVRLRRYGVGPLRRTDAVGLALLGMALTWAWRPQLVSFALMGVWWAILEASVDRPRRLWTLVPVLLVWEQLHGGFLLGLGTLGWWIVDRLWPGAAHPLRRREWRTVGPVLGTLALGLGCTPWGYGLVAHAWQESHNPIILEWIGEWQAPNFHDPLWLVVLALPVLVYGVWLYQHPDRVRLAPRWLWGLFVLTLGMTCLAIRNLPFFWLAFATLMAVTAPRPGRTLRLPIWAAGLLAAGALALMAVQAPRWFIPHRGLTPHLVAILRTRPGLVLNGYRAGDSLIAYGFPDMVDGRTDLWVAAGTFPATAEMEQGRWAWPRVAAWCRTHHVRYVLWPIASPGAHELAGRPGWRLLATGAGYGLWTHS